MVALESRETMPASSHEIEETLEEGIEISNCWGPKEVKVNEQGEVIGIVLKKCLSTIDPETKKFNPVYDEDETMELSCRKLVFAIGQAIEWGDLLKGTKVTFWHGNYPIADKFTYQTADEDIFVGGDVYTGPKFVIDAIAQGHEAAESLIRHVRPHAHMTIGRDRRYFLELDKSNLDFGAYDHAGREEERFDESIDRKTSWKEANIGLSEEQVARETARCLSCGATIVDQNRCIGCGICTTKCEFDAIHLVRDHPQNTNYRFAEDKIKGLGAYALKRAFKIIAHSGSKEAKMMRAKRKAYKKGLGKELKAKGMKHTGNAVKTPER